MVPEILDAKPAVKVLDYQRTLHYDEWEANWRIVFAVKQIEGFVLRLIGLLHDMGHDVHADDEDDTVVDD